MRCEVFCVSSRSDFVRSVMTKRATYFPLPGCIYGPLYNEVDFAKRAAADELKCRFAWCSLDCMCATCSYHRESRKTVVGSCFCSRCMSMWPQLTTGKWTTPLACAEALRSRRPHIINA
jgi:hypothetical protein